MFDIKDFEQEEKTVKFVFNFPVLVNYIELEFDESYDDAITVLDSEKQVITYSRYPWNSCLESKTSRKIAIPNWITKGEYYLQFEKEISLRSIKLAFRDFHVCVPSDFEKIYEENFNFENGKILRINIPQKPGILYPQIHFHREFTLKVEEYKKLELSYYSSPHVTNLFERVIPIDDGKVRVETEGYFENIFSISMMQRSDDEKADIVARLYRKPSGTINEIPTLKSFIYDMKLSESIRTTNSFDPYSSNGIYSDLFDVDVYPKTVSNMKFSITFAHGMERIRSEKRFCEPKITFRIFNYMNWRTGTLVLDTDIPIEKVVVRNLAWNRVDISKFKFSNYQQTILRDPVRIQKPCKSLVIIEGFVNHETVSDDRLDFGMNTGPFRTFRYSRILDANEVFDWSIDCEGAKITQIDIDE